jgi:lipoprotein-anchoring transpeptidase ErfK/SrfK
MAAAVLLVAATLAVVPATAVSARPAAVCRAGSLGRVGTPTTSYAAVALGRVQAYRRPGRLLLAGFGKLNQNGYPTTFLIVGAIVDNGCTATWYRVQLPLRPSGVVGYVRPADVAVEQVKTRIEVDLSARRLTFFRAGRRVLVTRVGIGSPATPTPVGRFYVSQRIETTDPDGPFGPAALGVSAFSPVLIGWPQGGPIAIHGTNEPWSIGRALSNGCIRVPNATLRRLFAVTYGGTPVVIHP